MNGDHTQQTRLKMETTTMAPPAEHKTIITGRVTDITPSTSRPPPSHPPVATDAIGQTATPTHNRAEHGAVPVC